MCTLLHSISFSLPLASCVTQAPGHPGSEEPEPPVAERPLIPEPQAPAVASPLAKPPVAPQPADKVC
jgi:topoisomerase (DNA) II binding protein 1